MFDNCIDTRDIWAAHVRKITAQHGDEITKKNQEVANLTTKLNLATNQTTTAQAKFDKSIIAIKEHNTKIERVTTAYEHYNEGESSTHSSYLKAKADCVAKVISLFAHFNTKQETNNIDTFNIDTLGKLNLGTISSLTDLNIEEQYKVNSICNSFDNAHNLLNDAVGALAPINVDEIA